MGSHNVTCHPTQVNTPRRNLRLVLDPPTPPKKLAANYFRKSGAISVNFTTRYYCVCGMVQWSLGVTLWETITYGSSPYVDVDISSYLCYINSGYRLPQLTNIPNEL